jgi:hypothetical protein
MRRRGSFLRFLFLALALPAVFVLASVNLHAQVDTGSIQGTIKDQSGAVIPGAKVTVTNEGTSLSLTTTAGPDGSYMFTPLKIGSYSVSAEARGFAKAVQSKLSLNIDQHIVVDLTLRPGGVTETIEVTAAPPLLQTQDTTVGQVVGSRDVNNLPLNGRNFTFLAQIAAGVNTPQADTRGNAASGAFTANGLRPSQNNYLLDGIDNNSDNVDFLNGTNFVVLPPPDAIGEFKVQTDNYSAEYGRAGAAILNATIKSGTNQFHGDVWEFVRNDKLDAADFFEDKEGLKKGEYRLNQFGGTIGGPIKKSKAFFFADYEGTRRRQGGVFTNAVPTPLERSSGYTNLADIILGQSGTYTDNLGRTIPNGTALDPATMRQTAAGQPDPVTGLTALYSGYVDDPFYTGGPVGKMTDFTTVCPSDTNCQLNQLPAGRLDPNAIKLLNLYPAATAVGTATSPITFNNQATNPVLRENRHAVDGRVDINRGDTDQIFTTFSYVKDPQFIPAPFTGIADGGAFQQGAQNAISILAALSETHEFSPTLINEARLGEDRLRATRYGPVATQMNLPAQFGIPGIAQVTDNGGLPAFSIGGLNTLGSNAYLPSDEVTQTTQATENLTKVYGKHTFKMGLEFQHIKFSTLQPSWSHGQLDYYGAFAGTGMAQFLLTPTTTTVPTGINYVGGSDAVFVSNFSPTDDGHNYWAGYFKDDWKVTPKLTLNLGLRWEHFGQVEENWGRQANFLPGVPGTGGGAVGTGAQYLEPNNVKNFQIPVNPAFPALLAQDGVALKFTSNYALATVSNKNFGPRVGLAYQFTPKLVVRTGFGLFYNAFENVGYGPNIGENYPFQFTLSYFNPNGGTPISFTNPNGSVCTPAATIEATFSCIPIDTSLVSPEGLGLEGRDYTYKTPYTMGYNFTLQYQISPSTTLTVAYVGDVSRHGNAFPAANYPSVFELNPLTPTSGPGSDLPFPDFGYGGSFQASEGNSAYNSLQTTLEKHYANGLNFNANYTWSHCRGDAGDPLNATGADTYRAPYLAGFGIQGDTLNCNYNIFDVGHFSGGYELPFGNGKRFLGQSHGVANQIIGGWQTVWNLTLEGGQPITIGCPYGTSDAGVAGISFGCTAFIVPGVSPYGKGAPDQFWNYNYFTQPCPAPGFPQPANCVPIHANIPVVPAGATASTHVTCGIACVGLLGGGDTQVSGPGIARLDFSLFKQFRITESKRLEFRSEFFNILNHPTFNAPGFSGNGVVAVPGSTDYLNTKAFGAIGSTRFPFQDPRQIQFALKFYF